jgi:hypothetical protein
LEGIHFDVDDDDDDDDVNSIKPIIAHQKPVLPLCRISVISVKRMV